MLQFTDLEEIITYLVKLEGLMSKIPVNQSESGELFLNSHYVTWDGHDSFIPII